MLINECNPRVSPEGNLRFSIPGFERSTGEITPWADGFDTRLIRKGKPSRSQLWALTLLPARPARPLPEDVQAFVDGIPVALRERIKRFAFGQALMLRTLARSPAARDLASAHPVIFWLMTAAAYDSRIDAEQLGRLSASKQVDVLARLINSRSKSKLRLLRKVDIDKGSLGEAHDLMRALGDPELVRVAAHQRRPSVGLLRALSAFPVLVQPSIVSILANEAASEAHLPLSAAEDLAGNVADIHRMAGVLGIGRPGQALSRCRSVADILRLHDRWVERLNRRRAIWQNPAAIVYVPRRSGARSVERLVPAALDPDTNSQWDFPRPPFPDSGAIEAIRTYQQLRQEGIAQGNCVASYVSSVASGRKFIYRVLEPQRATLELLRTPQGWQLGQLKLARNAAPTADVVASVGAWFEYHQGRDPET